MCIVMEQETDIPDNNSGNKERMVALERLCDQYEMLPYNFYSEIVMKTSDMNVCSEDNCNSFSAAVVPQLSLLISIFIIFNVIFNT